LSRDVSFGRPVGGRNRGLRAGWSAHALQNIILSEELRSDGDVDEISGYIRASESCAGLTDGVVAARVIGMDVSVQDVLNGLSGQLADGGENFVAGAREAGINHQDALISNLDCYVSTSAGDQVHIPLNGDGLDFLRARRDCETGKEESNGC
jgi:hypothetical protein